MEFSAVYIVPGSSWKNGYVESFNARLRNELLNGEIIYSPREAEIVIKSWKRHYNTVRPNASLSYRPLRKSSSKPSVSGRLRQPDPLSRPSTRWRHD